MKRFHYILILILLAAIVVPVLWSSSFGAGTSSTGSLNKGLVLNYPLDSAHKNASGQAVDTSSNSNIGTLNGSITIGAVVDRHNQANKATDFDGTDDWIATTSAPVNPASGNFSFTAWVNVDDFAVLDVDNEAMDIAVQTDGSGTGRVWLAIKRSAAGTFYLTSAFGGSATTGTTNWNSFTGSWKMVTLVYSGTTLTTYIDTTQEAQATRTAESATGALRIGAHKSPGTWDEEWNGKMSNARVYNRALSTTEISSLYNSYNPKISTGSLNKGLVAHYPLSQDTLKSSTTVADKSPNRNTGTLVGSPTFTTDQHSQANKAMSFNGSSQYVSIPSSSSLNPISITLSAWVYPNALTNGAKVITKDSGGGLDRAWQIQLNGTSGQVQFIAAAPIAWDVNILSSTNLNLGTWTHIVATVNSSSANLYFDGINVGTDASSGNLYTSSTFAVEIGGTSTGSWFLNGKISDVRIYNRALSSTEVTSLYNSYRPKISTGLLNKGLVGYWPLDSASNRSTTVTADKTPNRNHGTAASLGNPTLGGATDRHGQASKATEFDGDNDNINLGDLTYLNSVSKFSMSFWMNQDVLDQSDILFNKQSDATHRLFIAPWSNGNMYFEVIDTVSRGRFDYSTVISAGVWAHVVMIYDGTQADNATRLKVYVNSLQQSLTFEGTIPATTGNFSGYSAYLGYSSSAFDGKLADFRIYNRVLSAAEVTALYNAY